MFSISCLRRSLVALCLIIKQALLLHTTWCSPLLSARAFRKTIQIVQRGLIFIWSRLPAANSHSHGFVSHFFQLNGVALTQPFPERQDATWNLSSIFSLIRTRRFCASSHHCAKMRWPSSPKPCPLRIEYTKERMFKSFPNNWRHSRPPFVVFATSCTFYDGINFVIPSAEFTREVGWFAPAVWTPPIPPYVLHSVTTSNHLSSRRLSISFSKALQSTVS